MAREYCINLPPDRLALRIMRSELVRFGYRKLSDAQVLHYAALHFPVNVSLEQDALWRGETRQLQRRLRDHRVALKHGWDVARLGVPSLDKLLGE